MADGHHMLLISFTDPAGCRAAFEEARSLPGLRTLAIMERSADGTLEVPDSHVRGGGVPTVLGAVAGGLVGLLAGPAGAAVGASGGAVLANAAEVRQAQEGGAALIVLGPRVPDGVSMLVVDIREDSPQPADELARLHGGTVERLSAKEFTAQVRAAEKAAEDSASPS